MIQANPISERTELQHFRALCSDQDIVRILQGSGEKELATVDRSYLFRWCNPNTPESPLSRRARLALQVLRANLAGRTLVNLRIAHHNTALAASAFLTYANRIGSRKVVKEPILARFGAVGSRVKTVSGTASLESLERGEADIALAQANFLDDQLKQKGCRQLCVIAQASPLAIAAINIRRRQDVTGLKFACPFSLRDAMTEKALAPYGLSTDLVRPVPTAQEAAKQYISEKVDCIIGWEQWIRDVLQIVGEQRPCLKVPGEFFPDTQFAAYVNIHSDPAGIRSFLLALCQATEELSESPKESELVRLFSTIQETEFSTHFEISRAELTTAIAERAATFMISNLDVETILAFWQAEATRRSILNKKLTIQQ